MNIGCFCFVFYDSKSSFQIQKITGKLTDNESISQLKLQNKVCGTGTVLSGGQTVPKSP